MALRRLAYFFSDVAFSLQNLQVLTDEPILILRISLQKMQAKAYVFGRVP